MLDETDLQIARLQASTLELVTITDILVKGGTVEDVNAYILKRNGELDADLKLARKVLEGKLNEINRRQQAKAS